MRRGAAEVSAVQVSIELVRSIDWPQPLRKEIRKVQASKQGIEWAGWNWSFRSPEGDSMAPAAQPRESVLAGPCTGRPAPSPAGTGSR